MGALVATLGMTSGIVAANHSATGSSDSGMAGVSCLDVTGKGVVGSGGIILFADRVVCDGRHCS